MSATLIAVAIAIPVLVAVILWSRWMERRLTSLFRDRTSPDAQVRACCYLRESFMEEPGVAQIKDGTLSVFTVIGKEIRIPLEQVRLTRVRKNRYFLGRHPWWRKTCFYLETPKTTGLILGFSDPKPWSDLFKAS